MNIRDLSEFVATMSRNPELQKEFVALAARYGVSFGDDQLSEAELESVSGGTTQESSAGLQQQSTEIGDDASLNLAAYMDRQQQSTLMLSNLLKKMADTSSSIISNLK